MKTATQYYLFKSGALIGPVTSEKLEALQLSGELKNYAWIIDDANQKWSPVTSSPMENPFLATKESLKERDLSGAFLFMAKPYVGIVKGIHSFGLELLIPDPKSRKFGMAADTVLQLNLADETNEHAVNTKVIFQNAEEIAEGILLRFGWAVAPARL